MLFDLEPELQLAQIKEGALEIISEKDLLDKLKKSYKENTPLRVKCGIDPTGKNVHIGHALPYMNMRKFQELGHTGVVVIGDYTATIGDPTGKDSTRPTRSLEEVKIDGQGFLSQLMHILIPEKTEIRFQSEWFGGFGLADVLRLAGKMSVQQLLAHETFRNRITEGGSLRMHELLYPLLQGYDSIAIKSDVELGDPSQKFNILVGRDLQKDEGMSPQVAVFNPILLGTNGADKMSKSLNNYIAINDSASEKFGKLMSVPDYIVEHYLVYAGRSSKQETAELTNAVKENRLHPFELKKIMASKVLSFYHTQSEVESARAEFEAVFSKKNLPSDIAVYHCQEGESLLNIVKENSFVKSNSEFRRLVEQGGVKIDDIKVDSWEYRLSKGEYILKVGKLNFLKLKVS